MGCGNPPDLTAADEGLDGLSLSTKPNGANGGDQTHGGRSFVHDITTPQTISSGYSNFPLYDMLGDWQLCRPNRDNENYHFNDSANLNFSNDSKAYESLSNVRSDLSGFHRESGTLYPKLGTNECSQAVHGHNMGTPLSSAGYKSEVNMSFMQPKHGAATGYPIKMHGAEAKRFRIGTSPLDGKCSSPEFSTPVLPHVDNSGVTRNENDLIRAPQKVDGSFLTLGIGGGREVKPSNTFNPQEVANKLEDTIFLGSENSQVGQDLENLLMPAGLADRFARIRTTGAVSSSAVNLAGRMATLDAGGHIGNASASLKSMQFSGFQNPQDNAQPISSPNYNTPVFDQAPLSLPFRSAPVSQSECIKSNSRGPRGAEIMMSTQFSSQSIPQKQILPPNWEVAGGHIGNASASLKSMQFSGFQNPQDNAQPISSPNYNTPVFDQAPLSLPFRSAPVSQSECIKSNSRGPRGAEIMMSTQFSSQSIPQKQILPPNWHRGSSCDTAQQDGPYGEPIQLTEGRGTLSGTSVRFQPLGNLTFAAGSTRTEVARQGSPMVQPVGHFQTSQDIRQVHPHANSLFHERSGFPVPNWRGPYSAAAPFPKRLGVQPTDFSTSWTNNVHIQRPVRPPFAFGPPTNLPPWVNPFSSPMSSGQQHHGIPAHLRQIPPGSKPNIRPQASPSVASHSMLKRPATENPPAMHTSQRRKIVPQPAIHHSTTPYPRPNFPASVHIPRPSDHVKWEGFEEPLKPTGHKCYLCKRDLSFTAEGPVYQPPTPLPVAVLPCGHTFHDHCLHIITPEDQLKNPPCIPCAIGET